jgi:hypothetical protein
MKITQSKWKNKTQGWNPAFTNELEGKAQLVLLFGGKSVLTSPEYPECINKLQQAHPHAHLLGCSTAGEIYDTQVMDDSLVATAIYFENSQIQGHCIDLDIGEDSFHAGDRLGKAIDPQGLVHVFVLSDGIQVNGSDLVKGLGQNLPPNVSITGGLSGDGARFEETFIIWDGLPKKGAIAALGFYGDTLKVGYGSLGGWKPFGTERVITKSKGNVLYELDGESALALYKKYLGTHAKDLPSSGLRFPLKLQRETEELSVVRTILSVNEENQSLTFAGDVPEGTKVYLMQGADFKSLIAGANAAAITSRNALGNNISPELAILISCVGRKLVLKQDIESEVEEVREIMGTTPAITGFYSYGEISPFRPGAACELHNQTMTITTFSEAPFVSGAACELTP